MEALSLSRTDVPNGFSCAASPSNACQRPIVSFPGGRGGVVCNGKDV